jgi:hypothetical protein
MSDTDSASVPFQDALSMERAGSDAGLNPIFGEWQQTYLFA